MRIRKLLLAGTLVATMSLGVAACGGDDVDDAVDSATEQVGTAADSVEDALTGDDLTVTLTEQNGSGVTGDAGLASGDGQTKVTLKLENAPGPHPAHIHEGTCANLNPASKFPLTDVVDGTSETTVAVRLDAVRSKPHAINVHESAGNIQKYVACADLPSGGPTGTTTGGPSTQAP